LQSWGIKAIVAPDPVWALQAEAPSGLWELPAPRIAVCLRSHPLLTPERLATLTTALISLQSATGALILLVPFQERYDRAIAEYLRERINHSHLWIEENPRRLKGLFRGVEMTIAMRLHGVIMSASEGSRCFAISYDPKVRSVMTELDIQGYDLEGLPTSAQQISRDWLEFYANGSALDEVQLASLCDRAHIHQELLRSLAR
jgi:polysaccharide pyruvyl transferase CsaB